MHCHMCSQVRGWTVWLHWAAQMDSVEWLCRLGIPVLCPVCVTQCALGCSGLLCQRKARPSVHMEDAGDLSGRDWQDCLLGTDGWRESFISGHMTWV